MVMLRGESVKQGLHSIQIGVALNQIGQRAINFARIKMYSQCVYYKIVSPMYTCTIINILYLTEYRMNLYKNQTYTVRSGLGRIWSGSAQR